MAKVHYDYIPDEPSSRSKDGPCVWCRNGEFTSSTSIYCAKYGGKEDPRKVYYGCFEKHPTRKLRNIEDHYTWYIMTAICDILNIDESNEFFTKIGTLIDLVREDITTNNEASIYDSIGPEIAVRLYNENNRLEFCKNLMINYLLKAFIAVDENRLEDAINTYKDMVKFLFIRYSRKDNYETIIDTDAITKPKMLIKK